MTTRGSPARDSLPVIEVGFPDIERWATGNTGIAYAWTFDSGRPGPHALIQALTHGNEVCGAIAVDWALREELRPARGRLSLVFANVEAYHAFDPADPFASRCVQEDFNRLWTAEVLESERASVDLARARELRPLYETVDVLLDLHSMTDPCPPLAMAGNHPKGVTLARAMGMPAHIIVDAGHAAGKRLRDYAFFDESEDSRSAVLVECGQHWERSSPKVAKEATLRFLQHLEMLDAALKLPAADVAQRVIEVTTVVTIATAEFAFAVPAPPLGVVPDAGTVLARDGAHEIVTPYDDCVLIMPTRRPKIGETAVRLGRFVS